MRLVIFTNHYPYGKGEEFLEPEMKIAERFFDNITIVTMEKKQDTITKYVPWKAKIIRARGNINRFNRMLSLVTTFFKLSILKEIVFSFKRFPEYGLMTIIKRVFIEESAINYIISSEKLWLSNSEKTIYYSFWIHIRRSFSGMSCTCVPFCSTRRPTITNTKAIHCPCYFLFCTQTNIIKATSSSRAPSKGTLGAKGAKYFMSSLFAFFTLSGL